MMNRYLPWFLIVGLSIGVIAVYLPVRSFVFLSYDDPKVVTENPWVLQGITFDTLWWSIRTGHFSNWHPLTWWSFLLEVEFFGPDPGAMHLTNVCLHLLTTWLLFRVLQQMLGSVWLSVFITGCYALHPLHVQSVAWIAERKGLLSSLFWMLAWERYVAYSKQPNLRRALEVHLALALG